MSQDPSTAPASPPAKDHGRAGRDLPKAIASGVTLGGILALTLLFFDPAFMLVVAIALVVAVWEMHRGLSAKGIDIPEQPLMVGGVVMLILAYVWGPPALVTATAVTALVIMLWVLRRGVSGFVQNASASIFTLVYVALLPRRPDGSPRLARRHDRADLAGFALSGVLRPGPVEPRRS
jgi:phosphatidate cytidylyltransferase